MYRLFAISPYSTANTCNMGYMHRLVHTLQPTSTILIHAFNFPKHNPATKYQAFQGILSDMLAFLESADEEENERMENMLHEIADPSRDEDFPTTKHRGHCRNLATGTSSRIASVFVFGATANQLSWCDNGTPVDQVTSGIPFTTMVLTLWTWIGGIDMVLASPAYEDGASLRSKDGGPTRRSTKRRHCKVCCSSPCEGTMEDWKERGSMATMVWWCDIIKAGLGCSVASATVLTAHHRSVNASGRSLKRPMIWATRMSRLGTIAMSPRCNWPFLWTTRPSSTS